MSNTKKEKADSRETIRNQKSNNSIAEIRKKPQEAKPPARKQINSKYQKESNQRIVGNLDIEIKIAKEIIESLPLTKVTDQQWGLICGATVNEYGEDGKALLKEVGPYDKTRGDTFEKHCNNYKGVSFTQVIHLANKEGKFVLTKDFKVRSRTPGQIILEELFNNGKEFASIGENLLKYQNGYYKQLGDNPLYKQVGDYFNHYITDLVSGARAYASNGAIVEAVKFVKKQCYRDPDTINPPGINLRNGYLELDYSKNGEAIFTLKQHSPDYFFTYKSEFDFDPEADATILNQALADMLDPDSTTVLLRILAAPMDLPTVRRVQSRAIKIPFLYGEGSNGKDTAREWTVEIYGRDGVTSVPLQVFKQADRGRTFDLYPIAYSKVNWSSENTRVDIDKCQTLKNIATGDVINVEQKGKQGFQIKPQAVSLFNVNEQPSIATLKESITSRYTVIPFNSVFKSNPDPSKLHEKKADSRLKDDPQYIREKILPALLNRLIEEFKNLLVKGIDYTTVDLCLDEIRKDSSHFYEFISCSGLIECNHKQGLTASEIYSRYLEWCEAEGLIERQSSGSIRFNDPHPQYDRIIRDYRQLSKELMRFFPSLLRTHGGKGRTLSLRFKDDPVAEDPF